jgi:hypothetical protein
VLTFQEQDHRYAWNGVVVPSVTQALDVLAPNAFAHVSRADLEAARRRGNAVHKIVELDLTDDLDEESVSEPLLGYMVAWRRFASDTGFKARSSELMLYSRRYGYAGRLDLLGEFAKRSMRWGPGIDAITLDVKSNNIPKTAAPQTAAYAQLLTENGYCGKGLRRRALCLSPDGYELSPPYINAADFTDFLAALRVLNWRNRK